MEDGEVEGLRNFQNNWGKPLVRGLVRGMKNKWGGDNSIHRVSGPDGSGIP